MRKKACRRADGRQKRRKTGLSEKPGKFWVLPPVPAETMDSQGNLTYPKPGFTVTDSWGLAPHSPLRQTAAGESISLYRFRWYYITYISQMQVFSFLFQTIFICTRKAPSPVHTFDGGNSFSFFSSGQNGPGQLARWRICSSWLLTLTVVQGGMEWVIKTLEPMTQSRPMTVSPPRMEAPA